jgi:predicted ester cyclase
LHGVLELPSVDAGGGWPIFAAPPTELAVHPTDEQQPEHELYLMCSDIDAVVAQLQARGIHTEPIQNRGWGLLTALEVADGETIGLYEPRHPSRLSNNKQLARDLFRLIDEMQSGKVPWSRFDEVVTPDFKAFVPGQTLDIDGFKQVMQSFGEAFSESSHTIFDLVCEGDAAMVREEWRGTHTGTFMGAGPTDKPVSSLVMCLVRFAGNKVREFHETFDTLSLMQQVGVIHA